MMFGQINGGKLRNVIMHNMIRANQKSILLCIVGCPHMQCLSNVLSYNCKTMENHYKHFVDKLIVYVTKM